MVKMSELYNGWCRAIGADKWVGEYDEELGELTCEQYLKEVKKAAYSIHPDNPKLLSPVELSMFMYHGHHCRKYPCLNKVMNDMDTITRHPFKVLACPEFYMRLIEMKTSEYEDHGRLWTASFEAANELAL